MADGAIDVLMRIVSKGRAMQAESATVFAVDKLVDRLRADFEPGQFCDLREFNFSAGAISEDPPPVGKDASELTKEIAKAVADRKRAAQLRAGNVGNLDAIDIQPVEFTRIFDTASTLLFEALVGCQTLDSISIAKRKAAGTSNSGEIYLRLDFEKVLITELDWKDAEHYVEETGTFIYRQIKVRYRPQNADGTLGSIIPMSWKMKVG